MDCHKQMQVIRHDYEIVEKEFPRHYIGPQDVDKKHGISLGLE